MRFQVLMSTVDDKFFERDYKSNLPMLIINQLIQKDKSNYDSLYLKSFKEKGLSKSRNRALENTEANICLIADDDVVFKEDASKIILDAFDENPNVDIITFQIETPEGEYFKDYRDKRFFHNMRTIMKVSSIEIAFRSERLIEKNILFDQKFGLGSQFPTGEEAIFLADCLRKGLKLMFYPATIVIHPKESSGGKFRNNPRLIKSKGAMFYRIFGVKAILISLLFALRKVKLSDLNVLDFYKLMLKGIKEFKDE